MLPKVYGEGLSCARIRKKWWVLSGQNVPQACAARLKATQPMTFCEGARVVSYGFRLIPYHRTLFSVIFHNATSVSFSHSLHSD